MPTHAGFCCEKEKPRLNLTLVKNADGRIVGCSPKWTMPKTSTRLLDEDIISLNSSIEILSEGDDEVVEVPVPEKITGDFDMEGPEVLVNLELEIKQDPEAEQNQGGSGLCFNSEPSTSTGKDLKKTCQGQNNRKQRTIWSKRHNSS